MNGRAHKFGKKLPPGCPILSLHAKSGSAPSFHRDHGGTGTVRQVVVVAFAKRPIDAGTSLRCTVLGSHGKIVARGRALRPAAANLQAGDDLAKRRTEEVDE